MIRFVDICQTDESDDFSRFGFKLIGRKTNGLKYWRRSENH